MDYDFHKGARWAASPQSLSLQDVNAEVLRGHLSSAEAKRVSYPVFHTCDFSGETGAGLHLPAQRTPQGTCGRQIMAGPGDILMARVDRLLHRKIAHVVEGYAAITDCIFRVRVPAEVRPRVLDALSSTAGGSVLASVARGVSARMISKRELLRVPLPIGMAYEQKF